MLSLSNEQWAQVMAFAYPLQRWQRNGYLRRVADLLRGLDFDDGDVHRAALLAQREAREAPRASPRSAAVMVGGRAQTIPAPGG